jgi:hypothetical protein
VLTRLGLRPLLLLLLKQEYKFQVQVPGKEDNKLLTVGRADLDMARYALSEGTAQSKMIPILFKVGMASTGYLKVSITAHVVASGTDSDDGMTEVSGMTGMTASLGDDQDLTGEQQPACGIDVHMVPARAYHGCLTGDCLTEQQVCILPGSCHASTMQDSHLHAAWTSNSTCRPV